MPKPENSQALVQEVALKEPEIELELRLGKLRLPLRKFANLVEGDLLRFSWNSEENARLCCGEELIASVQILSDGKEIFLKVKNIADEEENNPSHLR